MLSPTKLHLTQEDWRIISSTLRIIPPLNTVSILIITQIFSLNFILPSFITAWSQRAWNYQSTILWVPRPPNLIHFLWYQRHNSQTWSKSYENVFCSNLNSGDLIRPWFFKYCGRSTVTISAKLWPDRRIISKMESIHIYIRPGLWGHNWCVKRAQDISCNIIQCSM